jgi:hypothetical protein
MESLYSQSGYSSCPPTSPPTRGGTHGGIPRSTIEGHACPKINSSPNAHWKDGSTGEKTRRCVGRKPIPKGFLPRVSGGRGIRTPVPGIPESGFQDRRLQPLGHPSVDFNSKRQIQMISAFVQSPAPRRNITTTRRRGEFFGTRRIFRSESYSTGDRNRPRSMIGQSAGFRSYTAAGPSARRSTPLPADNSRKSR